MQRLSTKQRKKINEARTASRFEAIEVKTEFQLATEEQKAEIHALKAKIANHVISVNRPYSAVLSALAVPMTVGPLALYQYSPLNFVYQKMTQGLIKQTEDIIEKEMETLNFLVSDFQEVSNKIESDLYKRFMQKNPPAGKLSENAHTVLGILDKLPQIENDHSNPGLLAKLPNHKEYARSLKSNLIQFANVMYTMRAEAFLEPSATMKTHAKIMDVNLVDLNMLTPERRKHILETYPHYDLKQDIDKFTAQQLFDRTHKAIKDMEIFIPAAKEDLENPTLKKHFAETKAQMMMDSRINIAKIGIALTAQFSIVDSGLRWMRPYGMWEKSIQTDYISEAQANAVIRLLIDKEISTKKTAETNIGWARFFSWFVLPLTTYLLLSIEEDPSPEVVIFAFSLAVAAAKDLQQDFINYFFAENIENALKKSEARIDELLEGCSYARTTLQSDILSASQITISFQKSKGISPEKAASAFVDSLDHHNVPIVSLHQNKVKLAANFVENASMIRRGYHFTRRTFRMPAANDATVKLAKIRKTFQQNIARHNNILALKKQIKKLLTATSGSDTRFVQISKTDKNGLPDITIEFNLPDGMSGFTQELSNIFTNPSVVKVETLDNKKINVLIEQFTSVDDEKLKSLIQKIKRIPNKQNTQCENKSEASTALASKAESAEPEIVKPPKRWQLPKKELQPETKDETPAAIQERLANRLGVTVIAGAPIYPISNSQVRDYKSYTNSTHFVRNCLDPNKVPAELYKAVQNAVENAKFAAPRGDQGFLFWEHRERDQNKKKFTTSLKLKFLGDRLGDVRGLACKVLPDAKNDNGVIHQIIGVRYKAHKTQGR